MLPKSKGVLIKHTPFYLGLYLLAGKMCLGVTQREKGKQNKTKKKMS